MNDPIVLLLFLATWGGMVLVFRRLTDDFRKATLRQSEQSPAPAVDEELLRITAEVQETVEGLGEALTKRAEQLRTLIAEADSRIAALAAQPRSAAPAAAPAAEPSPAAPAARVPASGTTRGRGDALPLPLGERVPAERAAGEGPTPPVGQGADDVRRLAAEGHDVDTIARLTKRGREEVRIVLRRAPSQPAAGR